MQKFRKSNSLLAGTALLGAVALSGTTAIGGTLNMTVAAVVQTTLNEEVTTNMDFATIEVVPAGDVIFIDASGLGSGAGGASAVAEATGDSVVSGVSTSGLITVTSAIDFTVTATYEADDTVVMSDGTTNTFLNNIEPYSGCGAVTDTACDHTGGTPTEIHVGGEIDFPADSSTGTYNGAMDIVLNYT